MIGDRRYVRRGTGVHDLDLALVQLVGMPFGPQSNDGGIEIRADFACAADDHGLAEGWRAGSVSDEWGHGVPAVLPM
ncbi:hypothetical protein D9M71_804670 [compost metagenome]